MSSLADIAAVGDQKSRIELYKSLLTTCVAESNGEQLKQLIEHIVAEDVPLVASRQVLQEMAGALTSLPSALTKEIGLFAVEKIHPRVTSFEEQVSTIREKLAALYEEEEDWSNAAKMLAGIPLDSGIRVLEDNYKVEKYIKISMLYLEVRRDAPAAAAGGRAAVRSQRRGRAGGAGRAGGRLEGGGGRAAPRMGGGKALDAAAAPRSSTRPAPQDDEPVSAHATPTCERRATATLPLG